MSYIGSTPTTQSFIAGTDYFNGNGSTVNFTLSRSVNSVNDIEVIVNNVEQIPSGYSVSGTTLTFSAAPSAGTSNVYVRYLSTTNLSLAIPSGTSATFNTVTATTVNTTSLTTTNGASIQGLTVGKGAGAVATNTAFGYEALFSNTTASYNTAVGYQAGYTNTTGTENTFIGYRAGYTSNYNGEARNTAVGRSAGYGLTTGRYNNFFGAGTSGGSGELVTTGSKNTILGGYNGNQGGLDIRTASNNIVLSDGDGNPRMRADNNGQFYSLITGVGLYADYGCRAWVRFNGGSMASTGSGNVSSLTDNGVGDYSINFSTAMPDANYLYTSGDEGGFDVLRYTTSVSFATSSFRVKTGYLSSTTLTQADIGTIMLAVFR